MSSFKEVFNNLKNNEKISREKWGGKRYLQLNEFQLSAGEILEFELMLNLKFKSSPWKESVSFNEDLLADDWKVVTEEEINFFLLSERDLKKYGVSDEDIEGLKPKQEDEVIVNKILAGQDIRNFEDLIGKDMPTYNFPLYQAPEIQVKKNNL